MTIKHANTMTGIDNPIYQTSKDEWNADHVLSDGTSSAPSLAFASETTLGLWRIGSQNAGFSGSLAIKGPRPWADPRAWTATGDGVTNDTTAFTGAMAAALDIHISEGSYVVDALTPRTGQKFTGAGWGAKLLASGAISVFSATSIDRVTIENLYIDGQQVAAGGAAGADGITGTDCSHWVIRNCYITRTARDAVSIRGTTSKGWLIQGNVIDDPMEDGVTLAAGSHHSVSGNRIYRPNDGVLVKGATYCSISGNVIEEPGSGSAGVSLGADTTSADYITVTGNTVLGVAGGGGGIIVNLSTFCTVTGNTLKTKARIGVSGSTDCVISGNTIDGYDDNHGLYVAVSGATASQRITVSNNVIRNISGTAHDGINVSSGTGHKVVGNHVETIADGHGINSTQADCGFIGNTISGITTTATRHGIASTGADCRIANNWVTGAREGILVTGSNTAITGNTVQGATNRGIRVDTVTGGTITGNITRNCTAEGIYVNDATRITITGNLSHDNTYGIRTTGTSDTNIVVGNNCYTNSTSNVTLAGTANQVNDIPSGALATPGLAFGAEISSGLYWIAAGRIGLSATGVQIAEFSRVSTAFFSIGATPAAAGILRIPNNTTITARNNANGADITLITLNTSDQVLLRSGTLTLGTGSASCALFLAGNGSATTPAYNFTNDTNNGLYYIGTDNWALAAGGVDVLRLNALASGVDYFTLTPGKSGTTPKLAVAGTTTDIDIGLDPQGAGLVDIQYAVTALGAGGAATLGLTGGSGPATTTQNSWLAVKINGTTSWVPVWR